MKPVIHIVYTDLVLVLICAPNMEESEFAVVFVVTVLLFCSIQPSQSSLHFIKGVRGKQTDYYHFVRSYRAIRF